jgi:hypothetical protein
LIDLFEFLGVREFRSSCSSGLKKCGHMSKTQHQQRPATQDVSSSRFFLKNEKRFERGVQQAALLAILENSYEFTPRHGRVHFNQMQGL